MQSRKQQWREVATAQQRELQRLRYEVELARRQFDRVNPDNRLVASELERRWESALRELQRLSSELNSNKMNTTRSYLFVFPASCVNHFHR